MEGKGEGRELREEKEGKVKGGLKGWEFGENEKRGKEMRGLEREKERKS